MKGIAKKMSTGGSNPFSYNGLYLATLVAIRDLKTSNGEFTIADFKVDVSNSQYPEGLFLTDNEDTPDLDTCSMVLEAFGAQPLADGATAEQIMAQLNQCIGKKCSILMLPQAKKGNPNGPKYHKLVKTKDFKYIQSASNVGVEYKGEIRQPKQSNNTQPKHDDMPF